MDKGENTEKVQALRNTAQKEGDANFNIEEQNNDGCLTDGDIESVWPSFIRKFSIFLNAIICIQADSTTGANKRGHLNSDHFCFSHCI